MTGTKQVRLRWQHVDLGWAWVEADLERPRIFGTSPVSFAAAWEAGVAASGKERPALEALREAGRLVLMQASWSLVRDWTDEGLAHCGIHEEVAVTPMEHEILSGTIELPVEEADQRTSGPKRLN